MKVAIALVLALLFAAGALAFTIDLTDEEKEAFRREEGCAWVTKAWLRSKLEDAFQQGKNSCKIDRNSI
jgi:hypothetical protein